MTESVADFIAEKPEANWITPLGIDSSLEQLVSIEARGETVADLGGGTGKLGREIASRRPKTEVITTDISRKATEKARRESRDYENHHIVRTNGLNGLEDEYFSQIYAVNVLQDMKNPRKSLAEIYDKLEQGGTAVLTAPGEESAGIFPEEAQYHDHELDLPYIEVPGQVNETDITYSQYILPENWIKEEAEEIGFSISRGPEKILSDPTGLPHMSEVLHEDYSPKVPDAAAYALEKLPSGAIRTAVDYTGKGPEVDLWVIER